MKPIVISRIKLYILYILSILFLVDIINIAVNNFKRFSWRASQSEARAKLMKLYNINYLHYKKYGHYTSNPLFFKSELEKIKPEKSANYTIYIDKNIIVNGKTYKDAIPICIEATISNDHFTAIAIGNIDSDNYYDIWMISDDKKLIHLQDDYLLK